MKACCSRSLTGQYVLLLQKRGKLLRPPDGQLVVSDSDEYCIQSSDEQTLIMNASQDEVESGTEHVKSCNAREDCYMSGMKKESGQLHND